MSKFPYPLQNPCLAFTVMLAAALDDIDNKLTPSVPLNNVNLYHLDKAERAKMGVGKWPGSLFGDGVRCRQTVDGGPLAVV